MVESHDLFTYLLLLKFPVTIRPILITALANLSRSSYVGMGRSSNAFSERVARDSMQAIIQAQVDERCLEFFSGDFRPPELWQALFVIVNFFPIV